MREPDERIDTWRAEISAALPGAADTVRELEEHLRDHVDAAIVAGAAWPEAFEAAQRQLGNPQDIAREFRRTHSRWFGAIASREMRVLACAGALIAFAGFVWTLALTLRALHDVVSGKLPLTRAALGLYILVSLAVVCGMVMRVSSRFLEVPNLRDARSLVAFLLLAVWLLSGPLVSNSPLRFWGQIATACSVFGALAMLWSTWVRCLGRSASRGPWCEEKPV